MLKSSIKPGADVFGDGSVIIILIYFTLVPKMRPGRGVHPFTGTITHVTSINGYLFRSNVSTIHLIIRRDFGEY